MSRISYSVMQGNELVRRSRSNCLDGRGELSLHDQSRSSLCDIGGVLSLLIYITEPLYRQQ